MDCTTHREILSAGLDGEARADEHARAVAHLATCPACTTWFDAATAVTRAVRVRPAEAVPDLTSAILMASPVPAPVDSLPVVRVGLALVAVAQLLIGQESLFDAAGLAAHLTREQGVWETALAIGFATAAWQPRRAPALVPLVGALVLGLFVTAGIDAADGSVAMLGEGHHLIALVGLALLVFGTRVATGHRDVVTG